MSTLIIPAAGLSTRFPGTRPKYSLTAPDGHSMLYKSVEGLLSKKQVERLIFTILKEHEEKYKFSAYIKSELESIAEQVECLILDKQTENQVQTIVKTIELKQISGPIHINDTDNAFTVELITNNIVTLVDLHKHKGKVNVANKSYAAVDEFGFLTNIVEKYIISHTFCCGLYSFANAAEFAYYADRNKPEYISQLIYNMLLDGHQFKVNYAQNYQDWGTLEDWTAYTKQFRTLFVDFDGVLVESTQNLSHQARRNVVAIHENCATLAKLQKEGKIQLIITTARPYSDRDFIEIFLSKYGLGVHTIITDCWHAHRTIINDFANTNSYPSCSAINLVRNSKDLEKYLSV